MNKAIFLFFILLICVVQNSYAQTRVDFGPQNSQIRSSIKYSVVGRYHAVFDKYQGVLTFDEKDLVVNNVFLEINAQSIRSSFAMLDRIVRSKQILNTEKFPRITFQSQSITKDEKGYQVKGLLDLHGVKKEFVSVFTQDNVKDEHTGAEEIVLKGKWVLKRKEYGIIWNKLLDHGGVVVGDHITVEREIKLPITSLQKDRK